MKKVYDFSKGKRGAVVPATGKTRITIYMDDAILSQFKAQSEKSGKGYQTLINEALKAYLGLTAQPVTQELVRKIVREELAAHG
ncbi:MAG: BrnA antitoxin family protein [Burkholderiales bacterium]